MSTTSTASIDARVLGSADESTGATGAGHGPPGLVASAPAPESQHAVQDEPPRPKYLDPEWMKEGVPDTKFYKDYPPDAWGEEASPNARVWKIYRDDRTTADAATLKSWNSTLDVLLIFAGLFSAVSTAFIVESYKSLQPDYTQYIANFLYAAATNSSVVNGGILIQMYPTAASLGPPDSFVHPSATSRWTNGLWFTSLVTSLTVALLCILVKQWLDEYHGRITRSAPSFRAWARRHQLYYRGLNTWGVPALISLLPLLLHISLFLFFGGLVLFLRPLDVAIAESLLAVLACVLLFYVLALMIPALRVECPSYMPLLSHARFVIIFGLAMLDSANLLLLRFIQTHFNETLRLRNSVMARFHSRTVSTSVRLYDLLTRTQRFAWETIAIDVQQLDLDGWALTTLLTSTNDTDIIDAGIEAIGATSAEATLEIIVRNIHYDIIYHRTNGDVLHTCASSSAFAVMTVARRVQAWWTFKMTQRRVFRVTSYPRHRPMADLYSFLGVGGMMIQLMGAYSGQWDIEDSHRDHYVAVATSLRDLLSAHVIAESLGGENSHDSCSGVLPSTSPGRATYLLFLAMLPELDISLGQNLVPVIMLTFCSGNFSQADSHEQVLALRAVCTALDECKLGRDVAAPSGHGDNDIIVLLDRLFVLITLNGDWVCNKAVRLFEHQLGLLSFSMLHLGLIPASLQWAQLPGFAAFVSQLPKFEQRVSHAGLMGFIALLERVDEPSYEETASFRQYWTCVATLLNLSCGFGLPSEIWLWDARGLAQIVANLLTDPQRTRFFLDPSSDAILSMFLQISGAVGSRILDALKGYSPFTTMAEGLSCLLCHRQRHQLVDTEFIAHFFTGPFLKTQFRQLITEHMRAMMMARHCARLSLTDMLHICDELENPSGGETALGEDDIAFVGRIRRGLLPGGELNGECAPSCSCMAQSAAPHLAESSVTRWRNRILRGLRPTSADITV